MSLHIKSLNGDTSFLLVFAPTIAPHTPSQALFPGAFSVLLDPWLEGPTHVYHPKFSTTTRTGTSCVQSLADLEHEPDMVLISQDKPDHCNQATLTRLPCDTSSRIVSMPGAINTIRSWNHFDESSLTTLPIYNPDNPDTVLRIALPPPSPSGSPGEVTITILAPSFDVSGLHHAIGITYRPPTTVLSQPSSRSSYVDLPPSPPKSPLSPTGPASTTVVPAPFNDRSRALSLLYCPHGLPYHVVETWAQRHLVAEAALPLTALLHSFDVITNPWWLGGTISHGLDGGREIARGLMPKVWVGAHDDDKDITGMGVKLMKTRKHDAKEVRQALGEDGVEVDEEGEGEDALSSLPPLLPPQADGELAGGDASRQGSESASSAASTMSGKARKKMKVVTLGVGEEFSIVG